MALCRLWSKSTKVSSDQSSAAEFVARHKIAGAFDQSGQYEKGLALEAELCTLAAKFACAHIEFECVEAKDGFFCGQHVIYRSGLMWGTQKHFYEDKLPPAYIGHREVFRHFTWRGAITGPVANHALIKGSHHLDANGIREGNMLSR